MEELTLTQAGNDLVDLVHTRATEIAMEMLAKLPEERRSQFLRCVRTITSQKIPANEQSQSTYAESSHKRNSLPTPAAKFTPLFASPAIIAECKGCHSSTIASKMECTQCQGDHRTATTHAAQLEGVPAGYELENNYPNPSNPQTRIHFSIPNALTVDIAVFDIHGRLVRNLVAAEHYESGRYSVEWDGKDNAGTKVASGAYFFRMQAGQFASTKRMTLLK